MLLQASSPRITSMQQHTAYLFLRLINPATAHIRLTIRNSDTESTSGNMTLQGTSLLRFFTTWIPSQNS